MYLLILKNWDVIGIHHYVSFRCTSFWAVCVHANIRLNFRFTSFFSGSVIIIWKSSGTMIFGTHPFDFFLVVSTAGTSAFSTENGSKCSQWAPQPKSSFCCSQDGLFLSWATCLLKKTHTSRRTGPNQALTVISLTRRGDRSALLIGIHKRG